MIKKPTYTKGLAICENQCDQARGLIGQTVADNLQVHIEALKDSVQVWKALATLFDKIDGVFAYYFEKKIHSIDPSEFDRIESFLAKNKTLNEKLNACGKDYKKNDTALIIIVEQKLPPSFDMFIQTRNRALEMSKGATTNTFEDFCLGLINEQDRLISNG